MHGSLLSPDLSHRGAREIKTRLSKAENERWSWQEGEREKIVVFRKKFEEDLNFKRREEKSTVESTLVWCPLNSA